MSARSRCSTSFAQRKAGGGGGGAASPDRAARSQQSARRRRRSRCSLFNKGALAEAEHHARNAVRIAPTDAQSHNLMGMIMTEAHRPQVGEHHYRRAMELLGDAERRSCSPTWPGT